MPQQALERLRQLGNQGANHVLDADIENYFGSIEHDKLREFIRRNYAHDEAGAWFFQNGPQRVYVDLEAAPWVWRIDDAPGWPVRSHTGQAAAVLSS